VSREAADCLMGIFGFRRVVDLRDARPAEAACSCGSWHAGTVATARAFQEEHAACRRRR
jgi:hypothetical protein